MSEGTAVTPDWLRANPLPRPDDGGDKDGRGSVLVVGGCAEVPGAVRLAGEAALRAGAGRLQLATARSVALHLAVAVPEALVLALDEMPGGCIAPSAAEALRERAGRVSALVIGPGMAVDGAEDLTAALLEAAGPDTVVLLDAAALAGLGASPDRVRRLDGRAVITPHAGEMAHLLGTDRDAVSADPLAAARRAADLLRAAVVMKGSRSWIVGADGAVLHSDHGHVGLATSGSGDTLSGIIAGLLARGMDPHRAAAWGAWLHAEAGHRLARRHGRIGLLARELPGEVPGIMRDLAEA